MPVLNPPAIKDGLGVVTSGYFFNFLLTGVHLQILNLGF